MFKIIYMEIVSIYYDNPRQHIKKQRHHVAGKQLSSQSYDFSSSHGPWRRLRVKELMLLNCGAGEDSLESLGKQGDQTSQS